MFFYLALFLPIGYNRGSGGMIVGKIVLYLAMSVDGYIADEQGGVSWLEGDAGYFVGAFRAQASGGEPEPALQALLSPPAR